MLSPRTRRLRNLLLTLGLLCYGLWLAGTALWQLGETAVFVHRAVVVTGTVEDLRQKPFESWAETLGSGNWSMPGDVSYQPIVRFTLPGNVGAIRFDLEADNVDYQRGQEIPIISPPDQPNKARIYRGKFLWGASCLRLGIGVLLALAGYALLRWQMGWRKRPARADKAPKKESPPAKKRRNTPAAAEPPAKPAPAKPKAPRKRKPRAEGEGGTTTPRKRKKAKSDAEADAEPKPKKKGRSRKKKCEPVQGEFPF